MNLRRHLLRLDHLVALDRTHTADRFGLLLVCGFFVRFLGIFRGRRTGVVGCSTPVRRVPRNLLRPLRRRRRRPPRRSQRRPHEPPAPPPPPRPPRHPRPHPHRRQIPLAPRPRRSSAGCSASSSAASRLWLPHRSPRSQTLVPLGSPRTLFVGDRGGLLALSTRPREPPAPPPRPRPSSSPIDSRRHSATASTSGWSAASASGSGSPATTASASGSVGFSFRFGLLRGFSFCDRLGLDRGLLDVGFLGFCF